eukprot:XP_019927290.1 PREDICTED: uncharacterized protein LOC109620094 [Crassostrea gigas]
MATSNNVNIPKYSDDIDEFDGSVLEYVTKDEEATLFANIADFKARRCFVKTKFHEMFVNIIDSCRKSRNSWTYLRGIQGLGKTSSVLYYVLDCRKNNDAGVHYFDLVEIEKKDKNLQTFSTFVEDFQSEDCFIIDHVTIFNSHYLDRIKEIVAGRIDKFILIEAGFTASAHTAEYDCGKELQLDEENFLKIWNGSLKSLGCQDHALSQKGKEVYDVFSKRFLVTPRLLHGVLDYMYSFRCIGKTVQQALARYTKQTREEIVHFKGCGDNEQYAQFLLHTTILLEHIPDEGEYIFTEKQATKILIAINIFETEYCIVTKDELDSNIELSELDLKEGDNFVKVRHLQPYLADAWRQRLPYHLQFVLENASDEIFTIMFRNGEAGKEFEKMLVEIQRNQGTVILPSNSTVLETVFEPSETKFDGSQSNDWLLLKVPRKNFLECNVPDNLTDIPEDLENHQKNVAKFAFYIKQRIGSTDKLLVYPQDQNLLGVDYFVYRTDSGGMEACSPAKKLKTKENSVLYLVQVATGATHRGDTIGQALDVVKRVFSDIDVTIHVVVIIAQSDYTPYTLTKCRFENITVLNLYENSSSVLQTLLQSNALLYKFYLQLIKKT